MIFLLNQHFFVEPLEKARETARYNRSNYIQNTFLKQIENKQQRTRQHLFNALFYYV